MIIADDNVRTLPFMDQFGMIWLQNFPFRIEMQWSVFIIPLEIVTAMMGITFGIQTMKALKIQPAITLRNE